MARLASAARIRISGRILRWRDKGRPGRGYNPSANSIQMNVRKCKEIKAERLGFPWKCFAESGLFNELRAKK
jgi:hypothetical protein